MTIAVHLADQLLSDAVSQLLLKMGDVKVITNGKRPAKGCTPDVLLVDSATLGQELLIRHPAAKVLFFDTGIPRERLCAALLTYRIHGILSLTIGSHVLKKALKTVSKGQFWNYNGSLEAPFQDTGATLSQEKINGLTGREQEIITCVCRGLSNKEVARRLALSEHTVKSHLTRIFRKLNVTSRSKLIALAGQSQEATSQTHRKVFS